MFVDPRWMMADWKTFEAMKRNEQNYFCSSQHRPSQTSGPLYADGLFARFPHQQLTQHVLENPTIRVILRLLWRIDT